jgi:prepilin-type N-terminal cleavage/methylation domain-containing protein
MKMGDKGGFTLVEILIVAVLGLVVVGATYQMILTSQEAYTVQIAQMQGQQTVRAGIDILSVELRELSAVEGDILTMNPDKVEVRAMRSFGLVCNTNASGSPILVKKMGRYFANGDSIFVFTDNDPDISSDDTILSGVVTGISLGQTCTGADTAQSLMVPDLATALANDTVRLGAPVRGFTTYTYGLYLRTGEYYLARESGGTTEPLVGPLSPNGVSFTYMDSNGVVTTDPTAVSQIEVTLRSRSNVTNERGPVTDSLTTTIYLRN